MPRPKKQHLKKRKDGRYCAVYKGHQFMGRTEDEALALRDEYKRLESYGIGSAYTLEDYCNYWLPLHKVGIKRHTYNAYASALEKLIEPIAQIQLPVLTVDHIAQAYAGMVGYSAGYISVACSLLTSVLDSALESGYIRRNPCRSKTIKAPKGTSGSHRAITEEERQLILSTPHRMQVPALVMLYCGLRRGEVSALMPSDITENQITVNKSVTFNVNRQEVGETKTTSGVRTVPVPAILKPFLSDLSGFPMRNINGELITERGWKGGWTAYMSALSKAAKHPVSIRCHDLRHTYCTMLRDAGVDIKIAQKWMGHADISMILKVYDHPSAGREKTALKALNKSLHMQNDMQKK